MSGLFGAIAKHDVVSEVYYGTDYHSHLGTKRGGMAFFNDANNTFTRSIHSLENSYFRNKFEDELHRFAGKSGIGIISDTDSQPILLNTRLGMFTLVTTSRITNLDELTARFLAQGGQFMENSQGFTNHTELIAKLICEENDFISGIENVQRQIKGSCSILILTNDYLLPARDKLGRTPIIIGKGDEGFCAASESCSFSNIGYDTHYNVGPGEIVRLTANQMESVLPAKSEMQICSFLWVYYGYPPSH
ncbi:MAG: amidophosphoribosyltransferase, partial [Bacteroidales bacterium]|nr:amidophosphoribosyltransferase [Bacteroidales bacterium]